MTHSHIRSEVNAYVELGWDKHNLPEDASEDELCEFVSEFMNIFIPLHFKWLASGNVRTTNIREHLFKIYQNSPFSGPRLLETINAKMLEFGFDGDGENRNKRWFLNENY